MPGGVPFAKAVFRHITRGVDGFAAMNSGLARELKTLLPGRNIVTLHDPVYVRSQPPHRGTGEHHNILWIGRLEPQKDPLLALEDIARRWARLRISPCWEKAACALTVEQASRSR